jgi:hypothetical protein
MAKLLIHAPPGALASSNVVPVLLREVDDGNRYGLEATVKIPRLAGGKGSLLAFNVRLGRSRPADRSWDGYAVARCSDGHLDAHAQAMFTLGARVVASVIRACLTKRAQPAQPIG